MSKFFILFGHPNPKSYTGAFKDITIATLKEMGHEIKETDLYSEGLTESLSYEDLNEGKKLEEGSVFDKHKASYQNKLTPKLVQQELEKLLWCDNIIIIAPMWWGSLPAVVKGWFEKVLIPGVTYDIDKFLDTGMLKGKKAMIVTTAGNKKEDFSEEGITGMSLKGYLHHYNYGTFEFCGIKALPPFAAYFTDGSSQQQRVQYLDDYKQILLRFDKIELLYPPKKNEEKKDNEDKISK